MFDYGIIKRRVTEGSDEEHNDWKVGHPILFPSVLFVGSTVNCSLQFRIPIDDEHTNHITWYFFRTAPARRSSGRRGSPTGRCRSTSRTDGSSRTW